MEKRKRNGMVTLGLPPKPDSYYTKIKGKCRWCGNMIVKEDGTINERRS